MNIAHRSPPRRILHIVGRMDRAGAETMIMNIYREIDRSQYQFDFIYFTSDRCDFDDEIEALGGRIFHASGSNSITRSLNLWRILRKNNWTVVQSHTLFSSGLNLLAAKVAGVPRRIAHSHNTSDINSVAVIGRFYQFCMRWILAWVSTDCVACGKAAASYLFTDKEHVEIIPNAVDICRFIEANGYATKKALAIPDGVITILQVGRLMAVKNHNWSVRLAAALKDAGIDFQMLFVGDGPDSDAIKEQINFLGLQQNIRLLGVRHDIPELMAASDVMLMPSLYEGFPVVLVESQASGLPAVISNTIYPEVDLGLGLVHFVELDNSPQCWIEKVLNSIKQPEVDLLIRQQRLETHGFSSKAGALRLVSLYRFS